MAKIGNNEDIHSELTIWQQNLNKSQTGQHDLISSGKLTSAGIDIAALQEPSINFLGRTIASRDWIPLYPSSHEKDPKKTRAITLISSKLPTENWEQLEFHSGDVVVIKITGSWGQIVLFNIYNDCTHDRTIHELTRFHRANRDSSQEEKPRQKPTTSSGLEISTGTTHFGTNRKIIGYSQETHWKQRRHL